MATGPLPVGGRDRGPLGGLDRIVRIVIGGEETSPVMRSKLALLGFLAGGLALASLGCSSAQGPSPAPATVRQVCFPSDVQPTCHFDVTLDLTRASHREVGRQYALAIQQARPDFEATIDHLLTLHVYVVKLIPRFQDLSFADFLRRARILHSNGLFNPDYADEIAGMLNALTVFNPHRLVGAVVNATTGADYPLDDALAGRRSLFFDLREAFETHTTLDGVVDSLKSPARLYVYNHLMFVADPSTAGVVENQTTP